VERDESLYSNMNLIELG